MAKKLLILLGIVVVLVLGNKLRSYQYALVPHPAETADEYSFAWLGLSLIENHYPIAWSGLGAYGKHDFEKINVDSIFDKDPGLKPFPIDKPWFDHPPLFGLLTGGYAYLKGVRTFAQAGVGVLRRPMLFLALVNTMLIFILATKLFDFKVGLLSSLLYSTVPIVVISSRLTVAENGYIPLYLLSLIFALMYFRSKKFYFWIFASITAAVAVLFKLSAVSISLTLIVLAIIEDKHKWKKLVFTSFVGAFSSLFAFAIYGAIFDFNIFLRVFTSNSQRFYGAGAEAFVNAIFQQKVTSSKFLTDGWILSSWLAFFMILFERWRKNLGLTFMVVSIFSYMSIFLLFGSESYGWYRFPFFPFLLITLAYVLMSLWTRLQLIPLFMIFLLPMGTSANRLLGITNFQQYAILLRLYGISAVLVFLASLLKNKKFEMLVRIVVILGFVFLIILNIKEVYYYTYQTWFFVT